MHFNKIKFLNNKKFNLIIKVLLFILTKYKKVEKKESKPIRLAKPNEVKNKSITQPNDSKTIKEKPQTESLLEFDEPVKNQQIPDFSNAWDNNNNNNQQQQQQNNQDQNLCNQNNINIRSKKIK